VVTVPDRRSPRRTLAAGIDRSPLNLGRIQPTHQPVFADASDFGDAVSDDDARCPRCEIELPPYAGRGQRRVWCSDRCRRAAWRQRQQDGRLIDLWNAQMNATDD